MITVTILSEKARKETTVSGGQLNPEGRVQCRRRTSRTSEVPQTVCVLPVVQETRRQLRIYCTVTGQNKNNKTER